MEQTDPNNPDPKPDNPTPDDTPPSIPDEPNPFPVTDPPLVPDAEPVRDPDPSFPEPIPGGPPDVVF